MNRKEYAYTTGTLGTPTDTVSYTYGDSQWGDLLTAYDGTAITSDNIGNTLSDGTWSYTWEHGRQLASMSDGTTSWTYTYNADGLRTKRTNGTDTYSYIYNGSQLTQMTKGTDTLYFTYDAGGAPLSVTYNGTIYYYVTNLQGDVVAILNSAGTAVTTYSYDAWGNPLSAAGTMASTLGTLNPLLYRGYVYDTETELYYLQSRYYDPYIGRFINADGQLNTDVILGYNMFAYTCNNPIMLKDSTGARPILSMTIGCETKEYKNASFAYMATLPYYNQIAQTQSSLQKMGFIDTSYKTAKDCTDTLIRNGIGTAVEKAHFFSQCAHETNLGKWLKEIGGAKYLQSKPYYPYYGAGYIQLTWESNYQAFASAMNDQQILKQGPSYVAANYAWSAAGWYWEARGINKAIANGADVRQVTRMVNGGYRGLSERQRYYDAFLLIFGG